MIAHVTDWADSIGAVRMRRPLPRRSRRNVLTTPMLSPRLEPSSRHQLVAWLAHVARTLMRPAYERITTPNHDFTEACVDSGFVRFRMQVVFLAGAASLAFGASAAAVAPKPVAGRCAYGLGVIL